jgi:hypothetical protein
MKETISFSFNWNNKLECNYFTTIRLRNETKYIIDKVYVISLKKVEKFEARIIKIKHFKLSDLNDYVAGLDTGYSLVESVSIINKMYPNVNFETTELSLILLCREKAKSNTKIALFCAAYTEFKGGLKYKVSASDSGKIKLVDVNELLLNHYFISDHFLFRDKHSISNYVKYFNELVALIHKPTKSKHPDVWNKAYEAKLSSKDQMEYWAHLRSLGLTAIKRMGKTIEWKIIQPNNL